MAKGLTSKEKLIILSLIDGWSGNLTWETFLDVLANSTGITLTKQAIHQSYPDLLRAFSEKRISLRAKSEAADYSSRSLPTLEESRNRLIAANKRLKEELDRLLGIHVTMIYNASIHGISEADLKKPLPPIDRSPTRRPKKR